MRNNFNLPEDKQPIDFKTLKEIFESNGILKEGMVLKMDGLENFIAMPIVGSFTHSLDYIEDPLFYEAVNGTLGFEDEDADFIVSKKPATLTGYLLYNAEHEVVGFTCFESQVEA